MPSHSMVMKPQTSTGLPPTRAVSDQCEPTGNSRPVALAWITDELIAEHRRVWSSRYRRIITEEEAIEIIMNIKRFAETVLDATAQERRP
ncbi:MAG: hypothetical protein IT430_02740 [Phycisphaerales bacterium]|nr:hypothetical protein [Phycisphaerales bacterium]